MTIDHSDDEIEYSLKNSTLINIPKNLPTHSQEWKEVSTWLLRQVVSLVCSGSNSVISTSTVFY